LYIPPGLEHLNKYTPHSCDEIFKRYKLPNRVIARFLQCSISHTYQMRKGQVRTPDKHDKRFWELVEILKKGGPPNEK